MKVTLDKGASLPLRAHSADAGLDLRCIRGGVIWPWHSRTFDTGVHVEIPRRHFGKIESKSGLNVNHSIVSCGGVIDEGYTGSVRVKLYNLGWKPYVFRRGDKVAQLVVMPCRTDSVEWVNALSEAERGDNGFGSTGR